MRGVMRGVFWFLRENQHWLIVGEGHCPLLGWDQLSDWEGDGLIAMVNSKDQLKMLLNANVPVLNTGSRFMHQDLPSVVTDNMAIGRMAAEHLLACGLERFLFAGEMRWKNERLRRDGFAEAVQAAGHSVETLSVPMHEYTTTDASVRYYPDMARLATGLQAMPKPIGVFAPNSVIAHAVVDAAQDADYLVPDQIAVLGVNDDPIICESTSPPLSAVAQPSEKIGLEAARRLDQLMRGNKIKEQHLLLPPLGVVARRSTDMMAVDDPVVAASLRFIRDHAQRPIDVIDVAEKVGLSRRSLETKFARMIGRTPAKEIRRVRIERAKKLLAETTDPITHIVFATGFNSRQVFSSIFHRETGLTPTAFRRQFQMDVLES